MTHEQLQQDISAGKAQIVENDKPVPTPPQFNDMAKYLPLLEILRRPKYDLSTAPTFIPKTFLEQIQFYENGATRRIYFFINGSWRYATLT
jgi:hypothetical protein